MYSLCSLLGVTLQFEKSTTQVQHNGQSHFLGKKSTKAEAGRAVDAALNSWVSTSATTKQWSVAHCMALSLFGNLNGKGICHKPLAVVQTCWNKCLWIEELQGCSKPTYHLPWFCLKASFALVLSSLLPQASYIMLAPCRKQIQSTVLARARMPSTLRRHMTLRA